MYLLPELNLRLRPVLLKMRPGTRLVTNSFTMGDWEPDMRDIVENKNIYFWYVPAKVEGKWQLDGGERKLALDLKQTFQMVSGKADVGGKSVDVDVTVDPSIIGGLVVKLGSRMVDGSLRTKLNSIRSRMKEVG